MIARPIPCLVAWLVLLAALPLQAGVGDPSGEQAERWREQALALEHGEGVMQDSNAAIALYCKAALAGDIRARYNLGWIYANGRGVPRNDGHASYMFGLAADQGDELALRMLAVVGPQGSKPPCVLQAEAAAEAKAAEERARAAAIAQAARIAAAEAAEAARIAAREAAEQQLLEERYTQLINNDQRRRILAIVHRLAPQYGIHPALAVALIRAESNFDPLAVSQKNAQGLMQLIPETAARFRVSRPFDAEQNIRGGLAYLRWLLAYFQGHVDLAVAAYNAGERAVDRFGGVPPYPETRGYIKRIREVYHLPTHPFDQQVADRSPLFRTDTSKPST